MTDLVTRLRSRSATTSADARAVCYEAADEIERLQPYETAWREAIQRGAELEAERDALYVCVDEEIQRWRNASELMNKAEAERDELRELLAAVMRNVTAMPVQLAKRINAALAKGE